MAMLEDLGKLIERDVEDIEDTDEEKGEEDRQRPTIKKIASDVADEEDEEEKSSGSEIGGILKHIEAVKDAVAFIDKMTTDEGNTTAFEAEVALRRAIDRMQDLADESYKSKKTKE